MRKLTPLLVLFLLLACNLPVVRLTPAQSTPQDELPSASTPEPVAATLTPIAIVEIPMSVTQIDGAAYQAYQSPGDPFRFVCGQPCGVDPKLIFAQYVGFGHAHRIMTKLTGVDILPEMVPVDIHIKGDKICGHLGDGPLAFTYYYPPKKPVICSYLFDYAQGLNGAAYTPAYAAQLDQQTIFIHEYLHLIFVGRFPSEVEAMHDFVTPLALYISLIGQSDSEIEPCAYHPQTPPGDFGGYLLQDLCAQNGFRLENLAPAMIEQDRLYQSGAGQLQRQGLAHPSPSVAQFRDILNRLLGSDTTQAFADACWPPVLFDNGYTLSYACTHPTATVAPTPLK